MNFIYKLIVGLFLVLAAFVTFAQDVYVQYDPYNYDYYTYSPVPLLLNYPYPYPYPYPYNYYYFNPYYPYPYAWGYYGAYYPYDGSFVAGAVLGGIVSGLLWGGSNGWYGGWNRWNNWNHWNHWNNWHHWNRNVPAVNTAIHPTTKAAKTNLQNIRQNKATLKTNKAVNKAAKRNKVSPRTLTNMHHTTVTHTHPVRKPTRTHATIHYQPHHTAPHYYHPGPVRGYNRGVAAPHYHSAPHFGGAPRGGFGGGHRR